MQLVKAAGIAYDKNTPHRVLCGLRRAEALQGAEALVVEKGVGSMTVFLTSSPTGPLDNSRPVAGVDRKNGLVKNLRRYWPEKARCLMIAADPEDREFNDGLCGDMVRLLGESGFFCSAMDIWDDRSQDISRETLHSYDVVILGGGHVPTQNDFFHRISLRGKLRGFRGLVLGISAGTMNCADVVYAQPELPGESVDPHYVRFLPGLGLTELNILPHYQMVKDWSLDGKRLYEDITFGDSAGRVFLALPDGSYVLVEEGRVTLWGEAYRIADGELRQICRDGENKRLLPGGCRLLEDCAR